MKKIATKNTIQNINLFYTNAYIREKNHFFAQKCNLKEHTNRHLNIKIHKCIHNNCNQRFITSGDLKSHVRRKHICI
ncbi:unnamed protein product, partial [Medioppia subpectinata]